jgi:hypothetical protein
LAAPLLAIRLGHLDDVHAGGCVNAAPAAINHRTMPSRFFLGSVTLRASCPDIRFGELNNFSINAGPAKSAAVRGGFFSGAITLIASYSGLGL